jgi:extracellular matrix protein 14
MRPDAFTALGLLALCPVLVAAAPHESLHSDHYHQANTPTSHPPRSWRRLSNAIIQKVWHLEDTQKTVTTDNAPSKGPGRDLLARYGNDIVLRFTITTADEASALAEAADTLFLDVWEFNSDWVDIRIAKDVVRPFPQYLQSPLPNMSA